MKCDYDLCAKKFELKQAYVMDTNSSLTFCNAECATASLLANLEEMVVTSDDLERDE